jgi:hypothetical protein
MNDPAIREFITYRLWVSQSYDSAQGHTVDSYTEYSDTKTLRIRANADMTILNQAVLEAGDLLFVMDPADTPDGVSLKDQIVDANDRTYKIKDIKHVFEVATVFHVEGHPR